MGNRYTSPLRQAIRSNDPETLREILEEAGEGASDLINEDYSADCLLGFCNCQRNLHSPLLSAITFSKGCEIVEILLKYGADPTLTGAWQQTGLHLAGRQNNLPIAKLLIKYHADLYQTDCDSHYPIHAAALSPASTRDRNVDVLTYYLEEIGKPEDVALKNGFGNTPLHEAARWGNVTSIRYLLDHGADPREKNNTGQTPYDVAQSDDVKQLLIVPPSTN
ncbi:hypothetical protein NP493_531g02022 [Ridgeia piscesae]|uniref:Uncharacterized protein n=1 Tax=Ridgeia piscesae TaxID=27915 RepID=A0AAD9KWL5_RIDPI|nr:hypothetical protein NP493_531g02022 [Ridgeia piscesae]